ncbi:penicillin acylase family protein [Pseudomonas typographi]|uniref:Acyl-homoserine lactone acylase QuiP n=1 Tax=Pseudomonas typographi TaxID=2715964 RepID=A0ABR7YZS0_9PSED|nr:penicillin acylase family protein [Pseudomonas typographi]MBD1598708.1 penicillin acylase family protein [Pseudomonas typographi]
MASPVSRPLLPRLAMATAAASLLGLGGCQNWLDDRYSNSLPPTRGVQPLMGLAQNVSVRRNELGMPLIESSNFHDALFALGYVHASDRISQMASMRLLAEGRLAELAGPAVLDVDRFMRTVDLKGRADELYEAASPRLKQFFEIYARGVNAWLYRYRDKLPMDLAQSGYSPEYWKPQDSALIFCLMNFSLSSNLHEEINALILAQKVGADKLAWLLPIYPDEALPFSEADKLKGLNLSGGFAGLDNVSEQLAALGQQGFAASNNWAFAPARSRSGKSLFANDTHLPLGIPSAWNFVQVRAPKYQAAGVSLAGIPAVVAGFNGQVAWGMTMVMGDTQDLFLEQLKRENGTLYYLEGGKWQRAGARNETYFIKGQRPVREVVYSTAHGPLLNTALGEQKLALQPSPLTSGYGLALKMPDFKGDKTLDAFFDLSRASSVEKAFDASREIRAIALNMVFADAHSIGWQVTGRYPNRKDGKGLVPSPGWNGQYDWDGYADPMLHPYDQDPPQGWLGTANQRTAQPGYGMQLSSSWYSPGRAERLAQLAATGKQDARGMIAMQYDQTTTFAAKLKTMFQAPGMAAPLKKAIDALPDAERAKAREALNRLLAFDGRLSATSADAALYALFLQQSTRQIFLDELGPEDSPSWKAFVANGDASYSAQADHLLGRDDSPFWDDVHTPQKEDKPAILARSLAAAVSAGEAQLGSDHAAWQWGNLHHYTFTSESTKLAPWLDAGQRAGLAALKGYLDRGPYPAGGDHDTLNAAAYHWGGSDFETWLAPAMRIVVDFGQAEPMIGQNSTGQSGNPASPHYADGIDAWLKGRYVTFPMQPQNFDKAYGTQRLTLVPGK